MDEFIHNSVRLHFDTGRAFELFTNNKLLEMWLIPPAKVERVIGGKHELFWEHNERENNRAIGCKVTAFESNQLIPFEGRSPKRYKHLANNADPLAHVVVSIHREDEWTTVHLVHSGWRSTSNWEEARQWQDRAWSVAMSTLKKNVNGE